MKLSEAIAALESGQIVRAGQRVLCALSGGADSVALAHILRSAADAAGYEVCAAHVHHGIRAESDEEFEFVKSLCDSMDMRLFTTRVDVPRIAQNTGEGIESAARRIRYEFFYRTAREQNCDLIALAHHSRDQAETVLMHALRGASVSGLAGMRPKSGMLIRPLLDVDPEELREYLNEHNLDFREDKTNADTRYTRNYVRHVILPDCERAYPGSRAGLCRLAKAAARDDDYMSSVADVAVRECLFEYPGGEFIVADKFRSLHPAIQARIAARAMRNSGHDPEQAGIERLLAALDGQTTNLPGDVRVSLGTNRIYLEYAGNGRGGRLLDALGESHDISIETIPTQIETSIGKLNIEPELLEADGSLHLGDGRWEQAVDAAALEGAQLRFRRAGDTIWPLGAPGEKKLKDYYIDKKVDRQVRGFLPVVARGSCVLWALGVGVARDCAVTPDTSKTALLRWQGLKLW